MLLKNLLVILFLSFNIYCFAQTGTLKGTITDERTGEKLVGASVSLGGTTIGASTDVSGNFTINNIKPGNYIIKANYIGYNVISKEITINAAQVTTVNFKLVINSDALQQVNIVGRLPNETEAAAMANERYSDNLKNVVSAQAIAKSPDINAANVLSRVSGITIQRNAGGDDAYAIIRGLEPRYNNTLINGVQIASPDSKTRLVSLSIVPSELLSRVEVDKTLTPEMDADAIGGTVNLVFKDAPEKREINVSGTIGYEQLFLDRKFIDFSKANISTYSPFEINGQGYLALPNDFTRSNLDFSKINPPPTETFSFNYGERFFEKKLGLEIGNVYNNLYFGSNTEGNSGSWNPNSPDHRPKIDDIITRNISSRQILNNFILHLDYKFNDKNKISLDNVFLYSRLEEANFAGDTSITGGNGGRTVPGTGPVSFNRQSTTDNQYVENLKLAGKHVLNNSFVFDWFGAFSNAFRRVPDQANISSNIAISYNPSTQVFTKTPEYFDNITRNWGHNEDKDYDISGNLAYKTSIKNSPLEIKIGGLYRNKSRYNYEDEYVLRPLANSDGSKPVFSNIYTSQWTVYNPLGANAYNVNNYDGFEYITSFYGQFKFNLPRLEIFGGVRAEITSEGFNIRQDITNAQGVTDNYTDILPSLNFKYKLTEKANLRLVYFSSLSRPAFFELVPTTPQSSGGSAEKGNPNLKHSTANNFDIRYELFPKGDEQFFIGAYYKDLINPIELTYVSSGTTTLTQPQNAPHATVAGFELAFTKFMGNFGLSGNYAYNYSDVNDAHKIDRLNPFSSNNQPNFVTEHRMLLGASVHDLNTSLLYRNIKRKFNAQLAFQFLGKTLIGTYAYSGDNYIQQPLTNLAFSADKSIGKHLTIFTKLNNLLNTHTKVVLYNFENGNEVTKATYLVGMRYNY